MGAGAISAAKRRARALHARNTQISARRAQEDPMAKGQEKPAKTNKPKLSTKEKQEKKKAKKENK
jgi:hypothetical protein